MSAQLHGPWALFLVRADGTFEAAPIVWCRNRALLAEVCGHLVGRPGVDVVMAPADMAGRPRSDLAKVLVAMKAHEN